MDNTEIVGIAGFGITIIGALVAFMRWVLNWVKERDMSRDEWLKQWQQEYQKREEILRIALQNNTLALDGVKRGSDRLEQSLNRQTENIKENTVATKQMTDKVTELFWKSIKNESSSS